MSDEEKRNVEILNNIKEYMQNSIDSGHHKFIYNDLDWDEKCVDIINAIDYFIEKVEQQQKEIEEKTTIIMAGAEKVKQLEKELEDYKKLKKDIVSKIMFWDKEELPDNERIISMLDTLIEEVSRLEDIEDKKVEVAVDFIEEKRDKYWKDKIRERIKEARKIRWHTPKLVIEYFEELLD